MGAYLRAAARQASSPPPAAASTPRPRRDRNNGWWNPKTPRFTPADPQEGTPACPHEGRLRPVSDRPGDELDKDARSLVNRLIDAGWQYTGSVGRKGQPTLKSPSGKTVTLPRHGARYSNRYLTAQIRKAT